MKDVNVLIVDDSALVRKTLAEILSGADGINVVGTASDPYVARQKIMKLNPDVLTLDVEMPRMDGLTFLRTMMRLRPMPVVMISSLTEKGADITLQALELGAIDFVPRPKSNGSSGLEEYRQEIIEKVLAAAIAKVRPTPGRPVAGTPSAVNYDGIPDIAPKLSADAILEAGTGSRKFRTTDPILAIGASTGGTEAIRHVLEAMPADAPGTVITQHIPSSFSAPFARHMNSVSAMNVSEAIDGQQVLSGHAYIAPGSHHMLLVRKGARYYVQLNDGPPVNRHKPSVDVLFRSVALNAGTNAVGVILTGMGDDGAKGLKELQETGAPTMAQDEATSVVWGMPGAAVNLGAAGGVFPLDRITPEILKQIAKS